jgi:ribosomal protein S18 acetylase RimI-like enzyme
MEVIIIKASLKEAEEISQLASTTFVQAFGHLWADKAVFEEYLSNTFSVDKISSSITKSNNVFWIAYSNNTPIGYAKLKKYSPNKLIAIANPAQLQKIYVLENYIGNQVGAKLQNEVFNEVRKNNIAELWLAVWDQNFKGIRFYENYGFVKHDKYHYTYKNLAFDYELMVKRMF